MPDHRPNGHEAEEERDKEAHLADLPQLIVVLQEAAGHGHAESHYLEVGQNTCPAIGHNLGAQHQHKEDLRIAGPHVLLEAGRLGLPGPMALVLSVLVEAVLQGE